VITQTTDQPVLKSSESDRIQIDNTAWGPGHRNGATPDAASIRPFTRSSSYETHYTKKSVTFGQQNCRKNFFSWKCQYDNLEITRKKLEPSCRFTVMMPQVFSGFSRNAGLANLVLLNWQNILRFLEIIALILIFSDFFIRSKFVTFGQLFFWKCANLLRKENKNLFVG